MGRSVKFSYLELSNRLGLASFIADSARLKWTGVSRYCAELLDLDTEQLHKTPEVWTDCIDEASLESVMSDVKSADPEADLLQFQFPFRGNPGKQITMRLLRVDTGDPGGRGYIGSVHVVSDSELLEIEAAKARDAQIETSARIQKSLLSGTYDQRIQGLEIAAETLPSQQVDGDFFDFLNLGSDGIDFIVGDVMGKGVQAALLGAGVKSAFYKVLLTNSYSAEKVPHLSAILQGVNRMVAGNLMRLGKFLTMYYCRIDMSRSLLRFIDAGHTSLIYYEAAQKRCWRIKGSNMPMGFSEDQNFREYILPLYHNDVLFFCSDGILEAENSENEQFGEERIMQVVQNNAESDSELLLKKIIGLTFFFAAEGFKDDVTAVAMKINRVEEPSLLRNSVDVSDAVSINTADIRESLEKDLSGSYPDMDSEEKAKLLIGWMELVSNTINYTDGSRTASWSLHKSKIIFSFEFDGDYFDWFNNQLPNIESFSESGYGGFLIGEAMDSSLLLQGLGRRKRLVLVKEVL